jgi:hypothetical protein
MDDGLANMLFPRQRPIHRRELHEVGPRAYDMGNLHPQPLFPVQTKTANARAEIEILRHIRKRCTV